MQISPAALGAIAGLALLVGGGVGYLTGSSAKPTGSNAFSSPASTASEVGPSAASTSVNKSEAKPGQTKAKGDSHPRRDANEIKPVVLEEFQELMKAMQIRMWGTRHFRAMADLQDRLAASDLGGMIEQLSGQPNPETMGIAFLFNAYGEQEPDKALAAAKSLKNKQAQQVAISATISALAASDPERALALLNTIDQPEIKNQAKSAVMLAIADQDPVGAISILKEGNRQDEMYASMIFMRVAAKDIELAKSEANQLTGRLKDNAVNAIVNQIANKDPVAAWEYAKSLDAQGTRNALDSVIQVWAQRDPAAAMKAAMSLPDLDKRTNMIANGVAGWAKTDFPAAIGYVKSLNDSTMRAEILARLGNTSSENSRALLSVVLEEMPAGDSFQNTVTNIFSNMARANPAEAATALKDLPQGRAYNSAASKIVSEWVTKGQNQTELMNWIQQLPEGEPRKNAYETAFREWARSNPQDAIQKLSGLSETDRSAATSSIASSWGRSDPEAALRWASTLPQEGVRNAAVNTTVNQWAQLSPSSAAKYVAQLPAAQQTGLIRTVVSTWASKDTEAAAAWVRPLPAGEAKDGAIESLVTKIAMEDYEGAMAWAGAIQNEGKRSSRQENLAKSWLKQDPAKARIWISSSSLSPEAKEKLLK